MRPASPASKKGSISIPSGHVESHMKSTATHQSSIISIISCNRAMFSRRLFRNLALSKRLRMSPTVWRTR